MKICNIGIISDTHNYLSEELLKELKGVDLIIHAGDIGEELILQRLKEIAPIHAVYGNTEGESLVRILPNQKIIEVYSKKIFVTHDLYLSLLKTKISKLGVDVVIFGHTHLAKIEKKKDILIINPGSPTSPRGGLSKSFAILSIELGNEGNANNISTELKEVNQTAEKCHIFRGT